MSLTQAQATALIRDLLDDASEKRWSSTVLDYYADLGYDNLWKRLHTDVFRYNSQRDNLASLTSPGYIDTASGGDLSKRFGALQSITRNAQEYGELDPAQVVLEDGAVVVAEDKGWIWIGNELHLFPYNTTDDVEIQYGYLPAAFSSLSSGDTVEWPDGHEMAYITQIAGFMFLKGGYETEAASAQLAVSEDLYTKMLGALKRRSPGPTTMRTTDMPEEYGGGT